MHSLVRKSLKEHAAVSAAVAHGMQPSFCTALAPTLTPPLQAGHRESLSLSLMGFRRDVCNRGGASRSIPQIRQFPLLLHASIAIHDG